MGISREHFTVPVMEHVNLLAESDTKVSPLSPAEFSVSQSAITPAVEKKSNEIVNGSKLARRGMSPGPETTLEVHVNGLSRHTTARPAMPSLNAEGSSRNSSPTVQSAPLSFPTSYANSVSLMTGIGAQNDVLGFPSDMALRDAVRLASSSTNLDPFNRSQSQLSPLVTVSHNNKRRGSRAHQERGLMPIDSEQPSSSGLGDSVTSSSSSHSKTSATTEVMKRRTLAEKIERIKDNESLNFFITQLENMTSVQVGMQLRRFCKNGNASLLPMAVQKKVFEGEEINRKLPSQTQMCSDATSTPGPSRSKSKYDAYETDVSDAEEPVESMHVDLLSYHLVQRMEIRADDMRICQYLDEMEMDKQLFQKTISKKPCPSYMFETAQAGEDTCARLRPCLNPSLRRELIKKSPNPPPPRVDYSLMEPSTSTTSRYAAVDESVHPRVNFNSDNIPVSARAESYMHEISCMPTLVRRKRVDKSIWTNVEEMEEERLRCGGFAKPEDPKKWRAARGGSGRFGREERSQRRGAGGRLASSDEELLSDTDDEYIPIPTKSSRRKEGSREKKKNRKRPLTEDRVDRDQPASKLGGRRATFPVAHKRSFTMDDVVMDYGSDFGISGLPQKIEYKEILIPAFRKVDMVEMMKQYAQDVDLEEAEEEDRAHRELIEQLHQDLVEKERQQVCMKKDRQVLSKLSQCLSSAESESQPGSPCSTSAKNTVNGDFASLEATMYESPSIATPYPPRKFLPMPWESVVLKK